MRPAVVGFGAAVIMLIFVSWTALISGFFYRASAKKSWSADLKSFFLHMPSNSPSGSVSYLADYPAIVLTTTVALSIYLVYSLFWSASRLHSDMESADCITFPSQTGRDELITAVTSINARFARWGKFAPITFIVMLASVTALNFRLETRLFTFLSTGDLYAHWWASLRPFRPGALAWIAFGTVGMYMVYVEAVLGLTYVRFLRKRRDAYRFGANMLNPDGLFGWARLRAIISNLEIGVVCTLLSSWALSFYLQPAVGSVATVLVLTTFGGVVLYVFISLTLSFRRQVRADRQSRRNKIGKMITEYSKKTDSESLLGLLVSYRELELVSKIPSVPVRPGWIAAGAITVAAPIAALVIQLLSYSNGR